MEKCWVSGIVAVCLLRNQKHIVCTYTQHSTSSHKWELLALRYDSWYFRLFLLIFCSFSDSFPHHSFRHSLHTWTCQFLRLDFGCKYCRSARVKARERRRVRKVEGSQSQLVLLLPHYWIWWEWNEKIKFTFPAIHGTHILSVPTPGWFSDWIIEFHISDSDWVHTMAWSWS